jgi:hypothetical protein
MIVLVYDGKSEGGYFDAGFSTRLRRDDFGRIRGGVRGPGGGHDDAPVPPPEAEQMKTQMLKRLHPKYAKHVKYSRATRPVGRHR